MCLIYLLFGRLLKKILSGLSESGGMRNASFATFSIGGVEGEAGAWGVLQCKSVILIWGCKYFPEENSLLTASAQIYIYFFWSISSMEHLVMVILCDCNTDRHGSYWRP